MKNGFKAALCSIVLVVAIVMLIALCGEYEYMPGAIQIVAAAYCFFLLVLLLRFASQSIIRRKKSKEHALVQRIRQTFESAQLTDEPQPEDILYLRPFQVDDTYMSELEYAGKQYYTVESVLCQMVEHAGRPVAIGRPGEELQPLGAHRIYTTDEKWQQKVREYFDRAKCVILYADFTPGVTWEIETAMSRYKDKLVLLPTIYRQKETLFRNIALFDPTGLITMIYMASSNWFSGKKGRRGYA